MMWQAPVISLTAQAFLLTIALDCTRSWVAQALSGFLAAFTASASVQLMKRHGAFEKADAEWLKNYEEKAMQCTPLHTKDAERPYVQLKCLARFKSHRVWSWALLLFGFVGLAAMLSAVFKPELLCPASKTTAHHAP